MPKDEQIQTFHFIFILSSIKMKVKFPCKMAIEHSGHAITQEVHSSEDGKFIFNQEVRLRQQSEKMFAQLNVSLVTQKGARYISGLIKLYHNELIRAEGERLVISLSKCLDPQALCEIKVEKVIREGVQKKRTLTTIPERNQKQNHRPNEEANPLMVEYKSPVKVDIPMINNETKSQAHFPVTSNMRFRKDDSQFRSKEYNGNGGNFFQHKRFGNASPKSKSRPMNSKAKYQTFDLNGEFERDKLIEAEVYKDNYQKLKHKYLKQAQNSKNELSRRMMLQNNENNYKLQIVRLKIRNEQLQNSLMEKNAKLKEYTNSLVALQSRQSQINFLREDIANKEHSMQVMDETIIALSKENDELRATNKEIAYKLEEKILLLESEMDSSDARSLAKIQDLERQLRMMGETLQFKQSQIVRKNQLLEKEKRSVHELERALQNKLFEYDSLLQNQRTNSKLKLDQTKMKVEESNQIIVKLNNQKSELQSQIDKMKGLLLKNEYEFKLYQQEMNTLRAQIEELRPLRDRYNDVYKQLRVISQQKISIEKSHEKLLHSKQSALEQITSQYRKQLDFQKRNVKDLEQRSKSLSSKLIEAEGQYQMAKVSLQKYKRNYQTLNKEYTDLKEKQKNIKKSLKLKEQECDDIKKQVNRLKEKNQTIFDSLKGEVSKTRQQSGRMKIQLESQMIKNEQLMQANSEINMQLARIKMTLQFSEQKYDKLLSSSQEKYGQFQKIIKQHEGVIQLLQQKIRSQKDNEKDYFNKLQKCDYQVSLVADKNDKIMKQTRTLQQKYKHLQYNYKNKQTQVNQTAKKLSQYQNKLSDSLDKCNQYKQHLQITKNQLDKSKSIIEILQRDYDKMKPELIGYAQRLSDKERELQQKVQQLRKQRQQSTTNENRLQTLKKQYDRFKDSVTQALNASFTQVINTFAIDKQESSRFSTIASIQHSNTSPHASKRGINDLSNDLVSAISLAGKQNKGQIFRLNDRNKQLQRDLQLMKNQLQRNSESNRRQTQQKTNFIEQLQEQIRNLKNDKGQSQVQYQMQIGELQQHIKQYQNECQSLLTAKNELEFSLTSIKLEAQRMVDEYEKKLHQLKIQRMQYEQKLQYQYHSTQIVEKKVHQLEVELMNINSVVMLEKEASYRKDIKAQQLEQERERLINECNTLRRQIKHAEEKYSQLEIQFITVSEIKAKYESMLSEEESKLKDVRIFNSSILKEKQEIIKKELEKNMEISTLESTISQLRHSLQQEEVGKSKYKADYEQIKENNRRLAQQIKQFENSLSFQKNKYNEVRQKLREKQQILCEIKEETVILKRKLEQSVTKSRQTIEQLKQQNETMTRQLNSITSQSSQSNRNLQGQAAKLNQMLQASREEIAELAESILMERENCQQLQDTIVKLRVELQDTKRRGEELEQHCDQISQQNRQKDETMFELGNKIYEYQARIREIEEERVRQLEELSSALNSKYDEDYQEIYQKIEFIEKQKQYFRQKFSERQQCISRKNQELKLKQIEQADLKRTYQDKIRKLQDQKLSIFADKNKELARALEENKAQFENIRVKQTQIRRVTHELEVARAALQKLQGKMREVQGERGNQIKAYQSEIQALKKRQLGFKSYKDIVRSNQWNCQREVRRHIQNFIKRILEAGEKESRNESVISLIKGLEEGLLCAVATIAKQ